MNVFAGKLPQPAGVAVGEWAPPAPREARRAPRASGAPRAPGPLWAPRAPLRIAGATARALGAGPAVFAAPAAAAGAAGAAAAEGGGDSFLSLSHDRSMAPFSQSGALSGMHGGSASFVRPLTAEVAPQPLAPPRPRPELPLGRVIAFLQKCALGEFKTPQSVKIRNSELEVVSSAAWGARRWPAMKAGDFHFFLTYFPLREPEAMQQPNLKAPTVLIRAEPPDYSLASPRVHVLRRWARLFWVIDAMRKYTTFPSGEPAVELAPVLTVSDNEGGQLLAIDAISLLADLIREEDAAVRDSVEKMGRLKVEHIGREGMRTVAHNPITAYHTQNVLWACATYVPERRDDRGASRTGSRTVGGSMTVDGSSRFYGGWAAVPPEY